MRVRDWLLPDEVQSAATAGAEMLRVVTQTSNFWIKQTVAAVVPISLGAALGYWLSEGGAQGAQAVALKDIMTGIMTFISVLAGFMVTLMLFTGRSGGAKLLSVDQAPLYVEKITYLLFSQAVTLAVHIVCILACLIWLIVQSHGQAMVLGQWLFVISIGLLILSMFRTLLLPFQIYEVHHFELTAMVEEKNEEFRKALRERQGL